MNTTSRFLISSAIATLALCTASVRADIFGTGGNAITINFVEIGNPGNPNDTVTASDGSGLHFGAVNYPYAIGKYKVTLTQYTAFLNAVAATDTYSLYNPSLATSLNTVGIARTGTAGSYHYLVIGDGQRPVTYVTWFNAARFTNWLHNGHPNTGSQKAATTEDGAYTLNGAVSDGSNIAKNVNAKYWIPSEDEWYKAAHYDPVSAGADACGTADYWLYPTRSDDAPGNVVGALPNQANYFTDQGSNVYSLTQSATYDPSLNYLTPVGVYTSSASHYGTFDQGGLLWEWNDAVIGTGPCIRGLRGNSWSIWNQAVCLQSITRGYSYPTYETNWIGFRVARLADSDVDGIFDPYETGTGIYVSPEDTGTSPTNSDSDNDGLRDGAEVFTYHTNPNLLDTDADGFLDGYEVLTGKSPIDPLDHPALVAEARTAIEFTFPAAVGKTYRIEDSTDLATWTTVETGIAGTGAVIQRFYSTRNVTKRYFRVADETAP
ncbi:MAG: SUMF1/EgtB/PvdO family nonheme iron enzyme [Verrucomicrobia bacterium]|nr:SUMF1/EgtB/PvdO family nonheme iron enzyme [Verrucomicrobiota bacterium]